MTPAMSAPQKHILIVLSSADKLPNGQPAGWFLPELVHPYYTFLDHFKLTIASPTGGQAPLNPQSVENYAQEPACARFLKDQHAQHLVTHTVKLADLSADGFDAIFYIMVPLSTSHDSDSIRLIQEFVAANKLISAVCHGPAAFVNVANPDGRPFIQGRRFVGFSYTEERAFGTFDAVPFHLEDVLVKQGGTFEKAKKDYDPYVVVDGNLYTGQNPASAAPLAEKVKAALLA